MARWIAPTGAARRIVLATGLVVVAALALASVRGWNVFDFTPEQSEDLTKPLASPWEAQQAESNAASAAVVAAEEERRRQADGVTAERVQRLIAEMNAPDPAVRERADVTLRNLPVSAAPLVETAYEKDKDALDPEPRGRIERSVAMFRALAKVERRRRERVEWVRNAHLAAYAEFGEGDPKWDTAARRVLTLAVEPEWDVEREKAIAEALAAATAAGCTDPLVTSYRVALDDRDPSIDEGLIVQAAMSVADAMGRSEYPSWIKVNVIVRCAGTIEDLQRGTFEAARADTSSLKSTAANAFRYGARKDDLTGMPETVLYDVARLAYWAQSNPDPRMSRFEEVYKQYERLARPGSAYVPLLKGAAYLDGANNYPEFMARTDRSFEDRETYRQRHLAVAAEHLKKALQIDPDIALAAMQMMKLQLARGDAEQAGQWFERAMDAYPDYREACRLRYQSMDADQRLAFGRELLRQGNWRGELPFVLVDAHAGLAARSWEKDIYFEKPEVWEDIRAVYEGYLALFPRNVYARSQYARYANRCRQWAEADRQFKILGENPALRVFGSMTSYNYHRKKAARNAGAAQQVYLE